jgi:nucleoside-diphosphate-sugar epimerase
VSRTALVTGGLGFLGRALVRRLATDGDTVTVVDALVRGGSSDGVPAGVRILVEDLRTCWALETLVAESDVVFHLAGLTSHPRSMEAPHEDLGHNYEATLALAEAHRRARSKARIVFTSTRQVYGRATRSPVDAAHPTAPPDVNGVHKLAAEHLLAVYASAHGLPSARLRLSNAYGPGQRLDPDLGFVGVFLRRALDRQPIEVYGDGSQARDLCFVDDAVDAIARAATLDGVWNVGGFSHTVREVGETIAAAAGVTVETVPWPAERAAIDVGDFAIDDAPFRRATGWAPRTTLREGVARTLESLRRGA